MYRLVIYFMLADLLQSVAQVFEVASVSYDHEQEIAYVRGGWETACVMFGFMDQVSMWMSNCVILWIMFYLLATVYRLLCFRYRDSITMDSGNASRLCGHKVKEVFGIFLVIVIPFTFNWVPFIWRMYGFSGLFCWIKEVSNNDCNDRRLSAILMFTMSYGPLLLLVFCGFLCFLIVTTLICCSLHSLEANEQLENQVKERLKRRFKRARLEVTIILVFPLVYCSLFAIVVANRLYSITHSSSHPVYPLWVAHVIASPGRLLVSPIAFLCHPYVWKTLLRRKHNVDYESSSAAYVVPPELDDIDEPLVIRSKMSYESIVSKDEGLFSSSR